MQHLLLFPCSSGCKNALEYCDLCILLVLLTSNSHHFYHFNRNFNKNYVIPINKQLDAKFLSYKFISILYMFRANLCSSSGESIVSIQHLVYVTLCMWPSGMQVGKKLPDLSRPAYRTVTNTEWHIPDVVLIQLILLMMSTRLLETCRESK
jgi:hypothetical protein